MTRFLRKLTDLDLGVVLMDEYLLENTRHRPAEDGPAVICYSLSGAIGQEIYYWHGRRHRKDGPAKIVYACTGVAVEEIYYRHGLVHRDPKDGPAWIERTRDGSVVTAERYSVCDQLYRNPAEGACEIVRDDAGEVIGEQYSDASEPDPRRSVCRVRVSAKKPSP